MAVQFTLAGDGFEPITISLERFEDRGEDLTVPLGRMVRKWESWEEDHFRKEGARWGSKWVPLSTKYAKWKKSKRPNAPILVFDGTLKASLTTTGAEGAVREIYSDRTRHGFVVGTSVEYAEAHQNGGEHLPKRPILYPIRTDEARELAKILQSWIVKGN